MRGSWCAFTRTNDQQANVLQIDAEAAKIVDDTMDGATLHDYLHGDGEWSPACLSALTEAPRPGTATSRPGSGQPASFEAHPEPAFAAIGFNEPLAAAVHAVRQCVQPPPQDAAPALDLPVRIAVVGGPFCGKTTLAQGLAEAHNAAILDAEVLVNNAVQAAGVYLDPEPQARIPLALDMHVAQPMATTYCFAGLLVMLQVPCSAFSLS